MTPTQSRMARAALKWSLTDLAQASGVGRATAARFELGESVGPVPVQAMRTAMEKAGARFVQPAGELGVMIPHRFDSANGG